MTLTKGGCTVTLQRIQSNNTPASIEEALKILLRLLDNVINDPINEKYRKIRVENKIIKEKLLSVHGVAELLSEIGFVLQDDNYFLPPNVLVAKLRETRNGIDTFLKTFGQEKQDEVIPKPVEKGESSGGGGAVSKKLKTIQLPVIKVSRPFHERVNFPKVITSASPFLQQIESLSDTVMQYEDDLLQKTGKSVIPIEKLRLQAIESLRRVQKEIKSGKCKDPEPAIEDLILYELAEWFKNDYFTWVNNALCPKCGNSDTKPFGQSVENGTRVEEFFCCNTPIKFYRYNDIATLLLTRKGRCGEWANVFTFFCRALGYEARYIYSTEDHIWTEVYSQHQKRWIHIDPSDNVVDAPLMYEHGWKKQLKYVLAFSNEDVQDVTWRYSNQHKDVLKRRNNCTEKSLLDTILAVRRKRQENLSEKRIIYLKRRTLKELADFLIEREPSEDEKRGRSSGSLAWRQARAETNQNTFHVFEPLDEEINSKRFSLRYSCASDKYERICLGKRIQESNSWNSLIYHSEGIFRKVEYDWKMVYLARHEEKPTASIMWRFDFSNAKLKIQDIQLKFEKNVFENGRIDLFFLDKNGLRVDDIKQLVGESKFSIKAELSGGKGDTAWQHTQLFRQKKDSDDFPFELNIKF